MWNANCGTAGRAKMTYSAVVFTACAACVCQFRRPIDSLWPTLQAFVTGFNCIVIINFYVIVTVSDFALGLFYKKNSTKIVRNQVTNYSLLLDMN